MAAHFVTTSLVTKRACIAAPRRQNVHASLHQGDKMCMHRCTVRESALKVDSERQIPCPARESNPHQYCGWLWSRALYQLNYLTFSFTMVL